MSLKNFIDSAKEREESVALTIMKRSASEPTWCVCTTDPKTDAILQVFDISTTAKVQSFLDVLTNSGLPVKFSDAYVFFDRPAIKINRKR